MIIKPTGVVDITVETVKPSGIVVEHQRVRNLVTNIGLSVLADRIAGLTRDPISGMGVGTGTSPVLPTNNVLTEVVRNPITETIKVGTNAVTFKMYLSSTQGNGLGTQTLTEIGLWDRPSPTNSGLLFARALLSTPITKSASVTVTFTWTINFAAT